MDLPFHDIVYHKAEGVARITIAAGLPPITILSRLATPMLNGEIEP